MVKMDNVSNLQVTFSKRRAGLFKKASELATLCGVEIAVIVFSPGQKPFSFGNPSLNAVINRFLNDHAPPHAVGPTDRYLEAQRKENDHLLNMELNGSLWQLDALTKHVQGIKKLARANSSQNWWEKPVDELTLPQLEQMKQAMEELRKDVARQTSEIMMDAAEASTPQHLPPQIFYGAGGSNAAGAVVLYGEKNATIAGPDFNIDWPLPQPVNMPRSVYNPSSSTGGTGCN
ncbi:hypothetical protein MLD38_023269 [Melastoma candidum]|uniref:Uncharacterized protein n=1 Tax=Melastoma candidum TaxID=119954 RepID=A0ACB9QLZ2_9MYRT|nr:hypothetical protein MLD38_023269 [Melastoma candidum]